MKTTLDSGLNAQEQQTEQRPVFMQEINESDLKGLKTAIVAYFKNNTHDYSKPGENNKLFRGNWSLLNVIAGFPYTSCGVFAALWVTNTNIWADSEHEYRIEGFTLDMGGYAYAVIVNDNENYIYKKIN